MKILKYLSLSVISLYLLTFLFVAIKYPETLVYVPNVPMTANISGIVSPACGNGIVETSSIIIDNTDAECELVGDWVNSTGVAGYYGSNYVHDGSTNSNPEKYAKFTPAITISGEYDLYLRWLASSDRASAVPVRIQHGDTYSDTTIDQRVNGAQWNYIGTYSFDKDKSNYVTISASAPGYTIVDAAKFTYKNSENCDDGLANGTAGSSCNQSCKLITPVCDNPLGACWYVNSNVIGDNNGTNWNDAWKDFSDITWSQINPGDIIYVAGGEYTGFTVGKSGTATHPITIRASQQSGLNGKVNITGSISLNGRNWITVNGAKDDDFYQSIENNTLNVPLIKNNINLKINGSNAINYGSGSGPQGIKILWTELTGPDWAGSNGIRFNPGGTLTEIKNIEIGYTWIHSVGQDGIAMANGLTTDFDAVIVHHTLIEQVGDDGIEHTIGGLTVRNSILRETRHARGHPDGMQLGGSKYRIYNNILYDWTSSALITQGCSANYSDIQIYGNLFYVVNRPSASTGIELKWYPECTPRADSNWSDWVFANNTIVGQDNGSLTIAKRDNLLTNAYLRNINFMNNIIHDSSGWNMSLKGCANDGWYYDQGDFVFENNVISRSSSSFAIGLDYNCQYFSNAEALNAGTIYSKNSSQTPNFASLQNHNYQLSANDTTAINKGVDLISLNLPRIDYDLAGNKRGEDGYWDIGAFEYTGQTQQPVCGNNIKEGNEVCDGTDLGLYNSCSVYPGFASGTLSCSNNCASYDTSKCVGVEEKLLLHLDFEDYNPNYNSTQGITTDQSENNLVANCQNSLNLSDGTQIILHNQCPTVVTGLNNGQAAEFSGSLCAPGSDYFYVNGDSFKEMRTGTISLWAFYDDTAYVGATLIDASGPTSYSTDSIRTWRIGRDNWSKCSQQSTRFMTGGYSLNGSCEDGRDDSYVNDYTLFIFPDSYYNSANKKWNHYSVTWDGTNVKGYFNGENFATVPQKYTFTTNDFYLALGASVHYTNRNTPSSGCVTQYSCPDLGGTCPSPAPSYVFPNNGFFKGKMDDIRIYNQTLTDQEIQAIYNNQEIIVANYTLNTNANNGAVTRSVDQNEYLSNTEIVLTATPNQNYTFSHWSGDISGSSNPTTIVMASNKTVTANFTYVEPPLVPLLLNTSAVNGTITKNPDLSTYGYGTSVTLTAIPNTNYAFANWTGSVSTTTNPTTIIMDGDKNMTANFTPGICTENWSCTNWSTCSNSSQSKTCTDTNNCGTTNTRPALTQSCTMPRSGGGGGGGGSSAPATSNISTTQNSNFTICQFIDLLIAIQAIQPDKAPAARAVFSCSGSSLISNNNIVAPVQSTSLLTVNLYPEMRHPEVKVLKSFLTKHGYLSDIAGTDYYGPLTTAGVQKFQVDYKIITSGTPATTGFGAVGPKTREVINQIK